MLIWVWKLDITKDDLGGVRVASVVDGSGADAAGIKEGDIITHINKAPSPVSLNYRSR